MKRFVTILTFFGLLAIPLLVKELITEDKNVESFDVLNSAYSVDCLKDFGYMNEQLIELSDGEWESQGRFDSELFVPRVGISEYFIADLVKESPGKEVIVELHCNDGATSSSFEVQVLNGANGERLGSILTEFIEYLYPFPSSGEIAVKNRKWSSGDAHCCHSSYEITSYRWKEKDWAEVSTEIWKKDTFKPANKDEVFGSLLQGGLNI